MAQHRSHLRKIAVILVMKIKIIRKLKWVVGRFTGNRGPALACQTAYEPG